MNIYKGKRELTMAHEYSWESKGKTGSCRCCGQFIKNDEKYYLVVIMGGEFYKKYPKEGNFIIHKGEFDNLAKDLGDEYLAMDSLLSKKRQSTSNRTPIDETMVEKFYQVARSQNLSIQSETRNRIYFKPRVRGRIGDFIYDKRKQGIYYNGTGFNGLFDRMFLSEIISRINEEIHDLPEGYRAGKVIDKATRQVDEMMKR